MLCSEAPHVEKEDTITPLTLEALPLIMGVIWSFRGEFSGYSICGANINVLHLLKFEVICVMLSLLKLLDTE